MAVSLQAGFFTRDQARRAGYDDRAVARQFRSGAWHRIRRGYYTFPVLWAAADDVQRHLITCRCVLDSMGDAVALSHISGCLAHGVEVWGISLDQVHVTRLDGGAGRSEAGVVHHEGLVTLDEVVEVDGMRVLPAARCVLEGGSAATSEQALVLLNSALHKSIASMDAIGTQFDRMAHWKFTQHLHVPVRMCSDKSESVGESRSLWLFWTQHIPAPDQQAAVYDEHKNLLGHADFAWAKYGGLGEFDGKVKYGRLLAPGQSPGDAVFREKVREDRLREATGAWMFRLIWADLSSPALTAQRLRRLMDSRRTR